MSNAVPSLTVLKQACHRVLTREVRPLRYSVLTKLALESLDVELGHADFRKAAEDVREKYLATPDGPALYIGAPHCLGLLREWVNGPTLLNPDVEGLRLYPDLPTAIQAAAESMLRLPHLQNKDGSSPLERAKRVAKGYMIEKAVASWARQQWKTLYRPPENDGRYQQPCDHDFRIWLPKSGRFLKIDVAGPGRDGLFGVTRFGKPMADVHIVAVMEELCVRVLGVLSREGFQLGRLTATQMQPLWAFMFPINCEVEGYTLDQIYQLVRFGPQAVDAP